LSRAAALRRLGDELAVHELVLHRLVAFGRVRLALLRELLVHRVDARLRNHHAVHDDAARAAGSRRRRGGGSFLGGFLLVLRARRDGESAGHEGDGEVPEVTLH
jgi:hypothetical protein